MRALSIVTVVFLKPCALGVKETLRTDCCSVNSQFNRVGQRIFIIAICCIQVNLFLLAADLQIGIGKSMQTQSW